MCAVFRTTFVVIETSWVRSAGPSELHVPLHTGTSSKCGGIYTSSLHLPDLVIGAVMTGPGEANQVGIRHVVAAFDNLANGAFVGLVDGVKFSRVILEQHHGIRVDDDTFELAGGIAVAGKAHALDRDHLSGPLRRVRADRHPFTASASAEHFARSSERQLRHEVLGKVEKWPVLGF